MPRRARAQDVLAIRRPAWWRGLRLATATTIAIWAAAPVAARARVAATSGGSDDSVSDLRGDRPVYVTGIGRVKLCKRCGQPEGAVPLPARARRRGAPWRSARWRRASNARPQGARRQGGDAGDGRAGRARRDDRRWARASKSSAALVAPSRTMSSRCRATTATASSRG